MNAMKMGPIGKSVLAISAMLFLTACKQDIALLDADNKVVGNGVLEVSANFPSPIKISMEGKEFSGTWTRKKIYEAEVAKRHRLISTRSYEEYMRGDSIDQLHLGQAVLTAQDGAEMACEFYYRAQPKEGICKINGKEQKLTFAD